MQKSKVALNNMDRVASMDVIIAAGESDAPRTNGSIYTLLFPMQNAAWYCLS